MEEKLPFERVKRMVIVKKEATSNPDFGCKPEDRSIEELIHYGVINLNKPAGPSSHMAADYVKKIFGSKKAGHSGTLESFA